ncbi:hypothetical protein ES708_07242 [subsurface metagenome]
MKNDHISWHALNIHPGSINVYYQSGVARQCIPRDTYKEDTDQNSTTKQPIQFQDNYHQGRISSIANRKISRAIVYLIHMCKPKQIHKPYHGRNFMFKLTFVTLTLSSPQVHIDQVIKSKLLDHFLIEMHRRWNVDLYVCRAEKQKNGNIHFHILADKFIPWNELRNVWNRIQQKLGYVTRYRERRLKWHEHGFNYDPKYAKSWPYKRQLQAYKVGNQTGWDNPNSVDIHSVRHIRNIKAYLIKELTKNEEYTKEQKRMFNNLPVEEQLKIREEKFVSGRLWSSSENLANLSGGQMDICSAVEKELEKVFQDDNKCVYDSDYFHVYNVDQATLRRLNCVLLIACFEDFIRKKFPERYLSVIT